MTETSLIDKKKSEIAQVKLTLNIKTDVFTLKTTASAYNEKADFWNELTTEAQTEIKKGLAQLDEGKRTSYKDVLRKVS